MYFEEAFYGSLLHGHCKCFIIMRERGQIFAIIMHMENLPFLKMKFIDIMSSQKQDGMHHKTIVFIFDEIGIVRLTCLISIENGLVCLMTWAWTALGLS